MIGQFFSLIFVAAVVCLLGRWLTSRTLSESAEIKPSSGDLVMAPSRAARRVVFGSAIAIPPLDALYVYVNLPLPQLAERVIVMLVVLFTLLMAAGALYDLRRRIHVTREGLQSFSPWTGRKSAKWNEVEAVSFRRWGQTIRIRLKGGRLIVIPCRTMTGLAQLEYRMREQLQRLVFEQAFYNYWTSSGQL